jgi:transcriptional regulator NrdR family protein
MKGPSQKRMKSCHENKVRFTTLEAAQKAAAGMAKRKAKSKAPIVTFLSAYGWIPYREVPQY